MRLPGPFAKFAPNLPAILRNFMVGAFFKMLQRPGFFATAAEPERGIYDLITKIWILSDFRLHPILPHFPRSLILGVRCPRFSP